MEASATGDGVSFSKLEKNTDAPFVLHRRTLGVTSFGLNEINLRPRQRWRIHRHRRQEEVYFVVEGTLTLMIEGEEHTLEAGEMARVAPDVKRQPVNKGPEPVTLLCLGGYGEHESRDAEAFTSWDQEEGAPPPEVPMPDDLPEG